MNKVIIRTLLLLILSHVGVLMAQDVEQLARAKPLEASGGLSLTQIVHSQSGASTSRAPYSYMLNGQLNLRLFGYLDAPFSFLYSNMGSRFTQPTFNQTAIHPKYRWIQLHAGIISESWSPYTVSGHVFRGVSAALSPGKWRLGLLYGRFQKASEPEGTVTGMETAAYRRMGTGITAGREAQRWKIQGTWFRAADDPQSIHIPVLISGLVPMENQTFGLKAGATLARKLSISGESGLSLLRRNDIQGMTYSVHKAGKLQLGWVMGGQQYNLNYERVDPGYRTMGAYYFNNDLENITAGGNLMLLKRKLGIQFQAGLQRDNLRHQKWSTMTRKVMNTTVQWTPGAKTRLQAGYSNFLSYTNIRPYTDYLNPNNPMLAWDTLNFRQISSQVNAGISRQIGSGTDVQQHLQFNMIMQTSGDRRQDVVLQEHLFYNAGGGYVNVNKRTGQSVNLTLNAGQTKAGEVLVMNFSPVLGLNRPFLNRRMQAGLALCQTWSRSAGGDSRFLQVRGSLNYTVKKVHRFHLSGYWQQNAGTAERRRVASIMLVYGMTLK